MQNYIPFVCLLVQVIIKPEQLQVKNPHQLEIGQSRVNHWSQNIKKSFQAQFFPDWTKIFHSRVKYLGMQKANICFVELAAQVIGIVGKLVTEVRHYIG